MIRPESAPSDITWAENVCDEMLSIFKEAASAGLDGMSPTQSIAPFKAVMSRALAALRKTSVHGNPSKRAPGAIASKAGKGEKMARRKDWVEQASKRRKVEKGPESGALAVTASGGGGRGGRGSGTFPHPRTFHLF